jgi:hypothetical protein
MSKLGRDSHGEACPLHLEIIEKAHIKDSNVCFLGIATMSDETSAQRYLRLAKESLDAAATFPDRAYFEI